MVAKFRKNKGWTEATWTVPKVFIKEEYLEPVIYWDDWNDPRDGMRWNPDRSMIRDPNMYFGLMDEIEKYNNKLKRKEKIRLARKSSPRNK